MCEQNPQAVKDTITHLNGTEESARQSYLELTDMGNHVSEERVTGNVKRNTKTLDIV